MSKPRRNYAVTPAFIQLIRDQLTHLNLGVKELAELVEVHPSTLHGVLGGYHKGMYAVTVEKMAKALDIPTQEFRKASNRKTAKYNQPVEKSDHTPKYVTYPEQDLRAATDADQQARSTSSYVNYQELAKWDAQRVSQPSTNTVTLTLPPRAQALDATTRAALEHALTAQLARLVDNALDAQYAPTSS